MKPTPFASRRAERAGSRRARTEISVALALLVMMGGSSGWAQTVPATPLAETRTEDEEVLKMEAVVSTGTRFNDRTVIASPVPIDIVTAREIRAGGYTETAQVLQTLIPSFNFPRATVADGTDHIRPASLRGLAPDQVLVLVNGKRFHTSALVNVNGSMGRGSVSTDLNAIPAMAIGRAEVLRDGASAQYGSDAIAGVINLVLRKDAGFGFTGTLGQYKEGDGTVREGAFWAGTELGEGGSLFATIYRKEREATNRARPDTRQLYFGTDIATGAPTPISGAPGSGTGAPPPGIAFDPREATANRLNQTYGDGEQTDTGLFLNAELPAGNGFTTYLFGGYTERDSEAAGFFRRPGDDRTVRALWPDGFLPVIATEITDYSIGAGVKNTAAGWNWDLSVVTGENDLEYHVKNSNNATLGASSPRKFYAGKLKFGQTTFNLDVSNRFDIGLRNPLKVALGSEYRREKYTIGPGEPDSYRDGGVRVLDGPNAGALAAPGAQVFPGFRPGDSGSIDRNSYAFYGEVENQLNELWLLSAAARFEDYSDFGTTTDYKLATRVEVAPRMAVRGAVSTGFRAPHLAQQRFSTTSTNFIGGQPFEVRTFPVTDPVAVALGARRLRPEESFNYSVGFTFQPLERLTASIDYYNVAIDDRIVLSSNFTQAAIRPFLESQGLFGTTGGRYFTNAVDTETDGIDVSLRYVHDFADYGRSTFTAGYNRNSTKVKRVRPTPPQLAAIGVTTPIFDLTERVRMESGQPDQTVNLSVSHTIRRFTVFFRTIRYGEVEHVQATNATPAQVETVRAQGGRIRLAPTEPAGSNFQVIQTFEPKWIADLDLSYAITPKLRLSIGANNLFDVYPNENISLNNNNGIFPYSRDVPVFGFNGAFYYTRVSWTF